MMKRSTLNAAKYFSLLTILVTSCIAGHARPYISLPANGCFLNTTRKAGDTTKDKEAIRQLVSNYENAWNRHDPKGLADNYDTNATWVNWFGAYYIGKKDIQDHYEAVHTTYFKTSHYYTRLIEDIVFLAPDIAVSHVRTGLTGDARYPGQTFEFRRMIVLTRHDGIWRIFAGQNAKLTEGIK